MPFTLSFGIIGVMGVIGDFSLLTTITFCFGFTLE